MTEGSLVNILLFVVTGLFGWNAWLSNSLIALRVSVAGQYHSKPEIVEMLNSALSPINRELEEIKRILYLRAEHDPRFPGSRTPPEHRG